MWFLLDDERNLGCDVIARTPEGAKLILSACGKYFEGAVFDHDLGCTETGYDVLCWAIENDCLPNKVEIVTANPPGYQRMQFAVEKAGYKRNGNIWEKKETKP